MRNFIFILLFIYSSYLTAQNEHQDLSLFSKGEATYNLLYDGFDIDYALEDLDTTLVEENVEYQLLKEFKIGILDRSLEYYEELIDTYPNSDLLFRAMNNAALISKQLGYKDKAIQYNTQILKSDANDMEKGGVGSGIMAEPYALYKNRAAKNLAEIYLSKNEFQKALKYTQLTKKYPYQHFCGNEYAADDIYVATLYTKSYAGLNDTIKALDYALPHIFYNGLADNSNILKITINLLKKKYSTQKLKTELEKGLESIKIKSKKDYQVGTVTIFGREIQLPDDSFLIYSDDPSSYDEYKKLSDKEKYRRIFRESQFYKQF